MNLVGIAREIVTNISNINNINDPQYKVTPVGFLRFLLENPIRYTISNLKEIQSGHEHSLKIRYMRRGLESDTSDRDDCEFTITPDWGTAYVDRPYFTKIGIFISDDEMAHYEEAANRRVTIGTPNAVTSDLMLETLTVKLQGVFQKMDGNLLAEQALNWGINVVTGDNNPQLVTFGNSLSMNDGIVKLLSDYEENEMNGVPAIVGNGAISSYNIAQSLKTGIDLNGYGSNQTFQVYPDPKSAAIWGANHFGVFAPGFTGFVDFNRYVGNFAGLKGGSMFFTIPVPVRLANGTLRSLVFDAQLKYFDCPIYDENDPTKKIADRGWVLLISKSYGMFNTPEDIYEKEDRLYGVNGTFNYVGRTNDGIQITPTAGSEFAVRPTDDAVFKTEQS